MFEWPTSFTKALHAVLSLHVGVCVMKPHLRNVNGEVPFPHIGKMSTDANIRNYCVH